MKDYFQFSIFNYNHQPLKITKPVRLIELFAGIGSQAKALERLGVDFEHYRICEFDKYAVASYNAVHGTNFTTSDITKITAKDLGIVDTYKYLYMMTYSFPCQDLSLAGLGKGMQKGSGTRSGLLWEVERLLNECTELPQILLMENVTQVHGTANEEHFNEWIAFLESKGYSNYWKDLNAKDFGVPQNRNRTFMVSVLGDYIYEFPQEFPLELRLKDYLEDSVDEKFYLSDKMINFFTENTKKQQEKGNGFKFKPTDGSGIGKAVTTRAGGRMDDNFIEKPQERFFKQALETVNGEQITSNDNLSKLRIRKLTPKECWRLMGFDDADFEKAAIVNSNAQLYKQAGNSIVVDVLYYIFKKMYE